MSQRYLMGLDIGGGGGRCLVVDADTGAVTTAFRAWSLRAVPEIPMGAEFDVPRTWALLAEAAREACARAGASPDAVVGVAATSMRHGSVVLDAEGLEILAAPNRDARGMPEVLKLTAEHGEELHRRTGHWPNPIQPAGRLLWMKINAPDDFSRASAQLSLSDWLGYRLSGELACEASQAGESLLFELERPDWAWDLIERLDLPRAIFPRVLTSGARLGALTAGAADALGLRPGIPVAVGGGDTQCGLLGSGAITPGQLCAVVGTSAPVQQVTATPILDAEARVWSGHHVVPGRWVIESNAGGIGEGLDWIAGLLYPDREHPVVQLLAEAERSKPGAAGMLSTFGAEVMNARHLGVPVGHLTLSYLSAARDPERRCHLTRSIVEGMAYALRTNAAQVEHVSGIEAERLRLSGGLSRSALFTQLVSDVFGRPVEVPAASEATALGAAICAGVGAGVFGDLAEGAEKLVRLAREHVPDAPTAGLYGELYGGWSELREARAPSEAIAGALTLRGLASAATSPGPAEGDAFRPRILVTAEMDETGLDELRKLGDVEHAGFKQAMRLLTGEKLVEALEGVQIFVTEIDVADGAALARASDLRAIAVCRGDAVNVDVDACTELGIPVFNTPGRNADAVADLALSFMLMLARKLPEASAFLRAPGGEPGDMGRMGRAFGTLQGRELWGRTVGLVGLGAVGRKVVERLRPFGARVLVSDPYLHADAIRLADAEPVGLEELLERSDFVSLHAAVSDASRGMIGAEQLARMREGSFLINTARAALVDEAALVEALQSGHLGGAALDVFAVEPPGSDDPILACDNVIATPHVGGNTAEVAVHQGAIVAEELGRLRRGERPRHLLNPASLERFSWSDARPAPSADLVARLSTRRDAAVTDLQKDERAEKEDAGSQSAGRSTTADPATGATGKKMEAVVRAFAERLADDAGLRARAADREVVLHFALSDLGLGFYLGLQHGSVESGLGAPPRPASVELQLSAGLLDALFTGRGNAMEAAMAGELSFSGDTAKAMTLAELQADLERLYRAAREEAGDPGDLSALSAKA